MAEKVDSVLGKKITSYPTEYAPGILAREERLPNREPLEITGGEFTGWDVWHAYEASFLLNSGAPIQGILKFKYTSDSIYIVESKSLKLYLFSMMMEEMGTIKRLAIKNYIVTISRDLRAIVGSEVSVEFLDMSEKDVVTMETPLGYMDDAIILDQYLDEIDIDEYRENPDLLVAAWGPPGGHLKAISHSLRSNCKITNQPDFGSVYIDMMGLSVPTHESLLKYIISFRNEAHFHEEIVETIYKRIHERFKPSYLTVAAFYTRRGGIDINPVRTSSVRNALADPVISPLLDLTDFTYRMVRS